MRIVSFQKLVIRNGSYEFSKVEQPLVNGISVKDGLCCGFGFDSLSQIDFEDGFLFQEFENLLGVKSKGGLSHYVMTDITVPDDKVSVFYTYGGVRKFKVVEFSPRDIITNAFYVIEDTLHRLYKSITVLVTFTNDCIFNRDVDYFMENVDVNDLMIFRAPDMFGISAHSQYRLCGICGNVYTRHVTPQGCPVCSGKCYLASVNGLLTITS